MKIGKGRWVHLIILAIGENRKIKNISNAILSLNESSDSKLIHYLLRLNPFFTTAFGL